jgi:S-adenosylmethionine synthetase
MNTFRHTAEMVTDGHPDKFCDQVADAILDQILKEDSNSRAGIECLAKDNLLVVSGEVTTQAKLDVVLVARHVWEDIVGYGAGDQLAVINNIRPQSEDIARGAGNVDSSGGGVDHGGAGDQGIMVGYATSENDEFMPEEYRLARALCLRLKDLRETKELPWLRPDGKSQVTIADGRVQSVIIAAHHDKSVEIGTVREILRAKVIEVVGEVERIVVNGTGKFEQGGTHGDAGVVGRKIVVDAYGPRVPVGGGAYSGKDPTKVDRSAAYMARHIAKTIVANSVGNAKECYVTLAYGIGQFQPEMITAVTETGRELSDWVNATFSDLSPKAIIEYFGLQKPVGWSYCSSAAFGHYGRETFPWEKIANV